MLVRGRVPEGLHRRRVDFARCNAVVVSFRRHLAIRTSTIANATMAHCVKSSFKFVDGSPQQFESAYVISICSQIARAWQALSIAIPWMEDVSIF